MASNRGKTPNGKAVVVLVARDGWMWSWQGEWPSPERAALECFESLSIKEARSVIAAYCSAVEDMRRIELPAKVVV